MLVVDASCLYEAVARGELAEQVRVRLASDPNLAAPHIIDVEVLSIVRRDYLRGLLDQTQALLALQDLRRWPGQRFAHLALLERAWELRDNVRGWDAFYAALAETLNATLVTRDGRLARAPGLRCAVEVVRRPVANGNG